MRIRARPTADVVISGRTAGNEKDPDIILGGPRFIPITPAQIMERIRFGLAEGGVHAVGKQSIKTSTLIDFIEMHNGFTGTNHFTRSIFHGRTIGGIKRTFH